MPDAAYWRRWREEHPEYRERERERGRRRRAAGRGDRSAEYRARRDRERAKREAQAELDRQAANHPILTAAREVAASVVRPDRRTLYVDPLYEDAVSVAAEALWSHRGQPRAQDVARDAVASFVRSERAYRAMSAPLLDDLLAA